MVSSRTIDFENGHGNSNPVRVESANWAKNQRGGSGQIIQDCAQVCCGCVMFLYSVYHNHSKLFGII